MAMRQGAGPASGNVRLKALRHSYGWVSQQQLADAFEKKALECGLRLAVSVRQVRRWESAEPPWPTPDYQRVLQELFSRPLVDLGFTPPWDIAAGEPEAAEGWDPDTREHPAEPPAEEPDGYEADHDGDFRDDRRGHGSGYATPGRVPAQGGPVHGAAETPRTKTRHRPGAHATGRGPTARRSAAPQWNPAGPDSDGDNGYGQSPGPAPGDEGITYFGPVPQAGPSSPLRPPGVRNGERPYETPVPGLILPGDLRAPVSPRHAPALLFGATGEDNEFFRTGTGLGTAPAAVGPPLPGTTGRLGSAVAEQYGQLTVSYRQLYWVAPAAMTLIPVQQHVEMGIQLMESPGPARARRVVAASVAESAMLAGRITFFDQKNVDAARHYYRIALEAAHRAEDPLLAVAVRAHQSFIPGFGGRYELAQGLIGEARRVADDYAAPWEMRSWLAAVHAEIETMAGNAGEALHLIDWAEEIEKHPGQRRKPEWMDFYDGSRLQGFRGKAELMANRPEQARDALNEAVADLPALAVKQRAVLFADLADVAYLDRDLDETCGLLSRALDMLMQQAYAVGMDRILMVRQKLRPWNNAPAVKRLDETLSLWPRELTGTAGTDHELDRDDRSDRGDREARRRGLRRGDTEH